jgi:hypothetical protein
MRRKTSRVSRQASRNGQRRQMPVTGSNPPRLPWKQSEANTGRVTMDPGWPAHVWAAVDEYFLDDLGPRIRDLAKESAPSAPVIWPNPSRRTLRITTSSSRRQLPRSATTPPVWNWATA